MRTRPTPQSEHPQLPASWRPLNALGQNMLWVLPWHCFLAEDQAGSWEPFIYKQPENMPWPTLGSTGVWECLKIFSIPGVSSTGPCRLNFSTRRLSDATQASKREKSSLWKVGLYCVPNGNSSALAIGRHTEKEWWLQVQDLPHPDS